MDTLVRTILKGATHAKIMKKSISLAAIDSTDE